MLECKWTINQQFRMPSQARTALQNSFPICSPAEGPETSVLVREQLRQLFDNRAITSTRQAKDWKRNEAMAELENLTKRQREVYEFIRDKIQGRGYGPTVREIGTQFGISSPNGVMCHLKALEKKGLISREPNMSRAITLAQDSPMLAVEEDRSSRRGLPMAGRIAAGMLHEAIEQCDRIDLGELFDGDDLFVLEVRGDSMIEDQIADGDFVVVRKQEHASSGEIVVAMTDENEATLKRWFPEANRIRLQPANSSMQPIYVENAQVLGVVVGVVRKF